MVAHVEPLGITQGFGDHWLKYIGYKAWVDGIMGASSAMFFEPYSNNPKNKGTLRPIMRPEGREGAADEMTPAQRYTDAPPGNLLPHRFSASLPKNAWSVPGASSPSPVRSARAVATPSARMISASISALALSRSLR